MFARQKTNTKTPRITDLWHRPELATNNGQPAHGEGSAASIAKFLVAPLARMFRTANWKYGFRSLQ